MSYTYAKEKRETAQPAAQTKHRGGMTENAVPNSARLAALESGQVSPTAADKGRRVDLPEAMRAKMESSFGMDFSAVKLYESKTLGQTGADAMAQGNEIAFAPGKLDFASQSGQALLGHELSHVASQARGQVRGNGFLYDGGLETRADREGAMAARGESVFAEGYGGAAAPLSTASAAPMAGPMQASSGKEKDVYKKNIKPLKGKGKGAKDEDFAVEGSEGYENLNADRWDEVTHKPNFFSKIFRGKKDTTYKVRKQNLRPWQMTREELQANPFNPGRANEISAVQESIDTANTAKDSYKALMDFTNNENAHLLSSDHKSDWNLQYRGEADPGNGKRTVVDKRAFTAKLKNMARQIHDYPELKDELGDMVEIELPNAEQSEQGTQGGQSEQGAQAEQGKEAAKENGKPNGKAPPKKYKARKQIPATNPNYKEKALSEAEEKKLNEKNERLDQLSKGRKDIWKKMKEKNKTNPYKSAVMTMGGASKYSQKLPISYNAMIDEDDETVKELRENMNEDSTLSGHGAADFDHTPNHELGHALNFSLVREQNRYEENGVKNNRNDFAYHITADNMLKEVLNKLIAEKEIDEKDIVYYQEDSEELGKDEEWDPKAELQEGNKWADEEPRHKKGQVDLKASNLDKLGVTTSYGATNAAEFFAEAFADVYANGKDARKASIYLAQLYDQKMDALKKSKKEREEAYMERLWKKQQGG